MGQCLGRKKKGRPREVREETEKGKERLMNEGAGQRTGAGRIIKEVRGPGRGSSWAPFASLSLQEGW